MCELKAPVLHVAEYYLANISLCTPAGLFDNVLSDYLWVRAVLLTGSLSFILGPVPIDESFTAISTRCCCWLWLAVPGI